jgi:signal transduction histidine kinase
MPSTGRPRSSPRYRCFGLGYTELIVDGVYGAPPERMSAVLKRSESNGRHLLGLINSMLDWSKIGAGQLVIDLADYSLDGVVQTVCTAWSHWPLIRGLPSRLRYRLTSFRPRRRTPVHTGSAQSLSDGVRR